MTRLPLPFELAQMPWPARQQLAARLRINPTRLRDYLMEHHAAALNAAWRIHNITAPTPPNPEKQLTICPDCGHPTPRKATCPTCATLSNHVPSQ